MRLSSGVWMIIAGWALAFVTLVYYFEYALQQKINPNSVKVLSQQSGELRLKLGDSGQYLADGWINGQEITFLVDTGAARTAVAASTAEAIGLPVGQRILLQGANGDFYGYTTTIEKLRIGNLLFSDVRAVIIPNADPDIALLGMQDVLELLNIKTQHGTMHLTPPAAAEDG